MHSNTIFGFLVLAFFVHITAQGKLPKYMGFFVGPVKSTSASSTSAAANKNPGVGGIISNTLHGLFTGPTGGGPLDSATQFGGTFMQWFTAPGS